MQAHTTLVGVDLLVCFLVAADADFVAADCCCEFILLFGCWCNFFLFSLAVFLARIYSH